MSRIHSLDRNCTSNNKNSNKSNNINKERDHNNNNNTDSGGTDHDSNKPKNTHISSETRNDNDNIIGNIQIGRPSHVTQCHVIEKNCAISSIQPCEGTTLETLV